MEEDNNVENNESLEEVSQEAPRSNRRGLGYSAGNGMQATGKTMKAAGTGMEYGGKAAKLSGKGISGVGKGISGAGDALNATGGGAILGVPLKALGTATDVLGKGTETLGNATEKAGKATKKAGDSVDKAGKQVKDAGKKANKVGKTSISDSQDKKFLKYFTIFSSLGCSSFFLIFFVLFVGVLVILGLIEATSFTSNASSSCLPSITSICESITVDGKTMDIDEYVAGVVNAEVGGMTDTNYNTYKAAAIAARSYALARSTKSNGKCSVKNSTSFQAYKENPNTDIVNAVNETSGIVLVKDNAVYGSEYDALCIESKDENNYYLCQGGTTEKNLQVPASWLEEKRSSTYIEETSQQTHGRGMSQNGAWYLALEKGFDYEAILNYFYSDEGATLASISGSTCGVTNFTELDTYNLNHAGLKVLDRTLNEGEINSLNEYINSEINKAGDGTNLGVAAAGQALVYGLEQIGYYLQYYWGGGHGGYGDKASTFVGVNPNWGSTSFGASQGGHGSYFGMDCSGFVSWAIRNACNNNANNTAAGWMSNSSNHKDLTQAKPGDIIVSSSHVQLVIKNNGDGTVIVAEETTGNADGLIFDKVSSSNLGSNYVGDMSSYYQNNCKASG